MKGVIIPDPSIFEGKLQSNGIPYKPVKDINENWLISVEEVNNTIDEDLLFVKQLTPIDYERPQSLLPINNNQN